VTAYLISNFGYLGLFLISFLAATLLPLSSEAAVVLLAVSEFDPLFMFWVVLGKAFRYFILIKAI
jgi:membrane protein YqaA with SNARE-associated domain